MSADVTGVAKASSGGAIKRVEMVIPGYSRVRGNEGQKLTIHNVASGEQPVMISVFADPGTDWEAEVSVDGGASTKSGKLTVPGNAGSDAWPADVTVP